MGKDTCFIAGVKGAKRESYAAYMTAKKEVSRMRGRLCGSTVGGKKRFPHNRFTVRMTEHPPETFHIDIYWVNGVSEAEVAAHAKDVIKQTPYKLHRKEIAK